MPFSSMKSERSALRAAGLPATRKARARPSRRAAGLPIEGLEPRRLLAAINSGQTIAGTLASIGQADDYTFAAAAGDRIFAALARTNLAPEMRLRIIAPGGSTLFDQSGTFGVTTDLPAPESGTYTLRASDAGDDETGGYNISLVKAPGPQSSDGDDGPFVSGAAVAGTLALGDIDVFPFTVTAGERVTIGISRTAGSPIEPRLDVVAPTGASLFGQTATIGQAVDLTLADGGTYYAVVRDGGVDEAGGYRVSFARPVVPTVSTSIGSGQYVEDSLAEGQFKMFRFTVPQAGADVRLGISRAAASVIEPRAEVYAPTGALVSSGTSTFGFTRDFNAAAAGEYVVVVGDGSADEAGEFGLTVAVGGATPANDRGPLVSGRQVRSSVQLGMLETFTFSGAAGETVVFAASRGVGSGIEPRLDLFRPDGTRLATDESTFGFELAVTLPTTGTYVAVMGDVAADEAGRYGLSMVRSSVGVGQQVGPLLGDQEGGPLLSGEGRKGFLDLADLDVYTVQASAGDRILAGMNRGNSSIEPKLYLFAPDGSVLASNNGTFGASVEAVAPTTGTHVVVAMDTSADEAGEYTLSLAVGRKPVATDPFDSDGGTLTTGQTRFGTITLGDSDVYTFDASAGSSFTLRMSRRNTSSVGPNLFLYGPDGSRQFASGTFDATLAVASAPATGTYTVVAADGGFDAAGGYAISLDATPAATDTTPPVALLGQLEFLRTGHVQVAFSEPVTNLVASSLTLNNLTTGAAVVVTGVTFDAGLNLATFTVTGGLPDGNYAASLPVGDIRDQANNLLAGPLAFGFFVFAGDANRDRVINLADFSILASNFNQPGATFGEGDFNYDGSVTIADFSILASKFNASLPAARPGAGREGAPSTLHDAGRGVPIAPFSVRRVVEFADLLQFDK